MKQAVPYIRFSTKKQVDSNSQQRQEEAIDRWLANNKDYVRFSKTFEDLGKSGSKGEHLKKGNGFYKLREAIKDGYIKSGDVVLVEAWDRATRQEPLDAIDAIKPILQAGVAIVTLDDGTIFTKESLTGSQFFLLAAKIQAAHGYSKQLSERTKDSYRIRRERAEKGELVKRHGPMWLNSDGGVIEDVAQQVAEVFDLYISGVGKHAIASRMRQSGVKQLEKCSGPTVQGWLTNLAVIGSWGCTDSTDQPIAGVYPAIIPDEKFHLAQKLLKERATAPRKRTSKHFLVGLVKCQHCGKSMVMHIIRGRAASMRCLTHHQFKAAGCINNKSIPVNVVKLVQVLTSQHAFKRALDKQTLTTTEKRRLAIDSEVGELTKSIGRLVALAMADDLPEVADQLRTLRGKRQALVYELAMLEAGNKVFNESLRAVTEQDQLQSSDPVVLNAQLQDAGYVIRCDNAGTLTTSEDGRRWEYLCPVRIPKTNTTEAFKVRMWTGRATTTLMINPDPTIEVAPLSPSDAEVDLRYARYAGLVLSAEDAGGEEEHLDQPAISWGSTV